MWKPFFDILDFLINFIPDGDKRKYLRRDKLFDYKKKLASLKKALPELKFRRVKMIKGGWNIGFIIDKKYVFKIRKSYRADAAESKIIREKRITDAFAPIVPIRIPNIMIIESDKYKFYGYEFIRGRNLNDMPVRRIARHRASLAKQLAGFIYAMHNSNPESIRDLATPTEPNSDGWNHSDLCNNIIVNPKTMKIVGIIDWEYAGFGPLTTEFKNIDRFSDTMKRAELAPAVVAEYTKLVRKKSRK